MDTEKEFFEWINIARGIGMLLVVIGHACRCVGDGNKFLFQFIYSFHMPLFFFISGFCSVKIFRLDGIKEKLSYCKNRAFRLIIPYIAVGIIYIPLDYIMGITDLYENGLKSVALHMILGDNPNWQLWTLYALFGCAVICCIFSKIKWYFFILIGVITQIIFCTPLVNIGFCTILVSIEEYLIYFISGLLIHKYYHKIKVPEKMLTGVIFLGAIVLFTINIFIYGKDIHRSIGFITAFLGISLVCWIAYKMEEKKNWMNRFFNIIGEYGMDIYILANLWQDLVRKILFEMLGINEWVVLMVSSFVGICVPIIISKYLIRKTKYIKTFLLGLK